jgi:hypothetical protein
MSHPVLKFRRSKAGQLCNFQLHVYHGDNKLIFNEMMMRSALYLTNTLSWIFIVLQCSSLKQLSADFSVSSSDENVL